MCVRHVCGPLFPRLGIAVRHIYLGTGMDDNEEVCVLSSP